MTTPALPIGSRVRRTHGRLAGAEGIVTGLDPARDVVYASYPLAPGRRIIRGLRPAELELVDVGPYPLPLAGVVGIIG